MLCTTYIDKHSPLCSRDPRTIVKRALLFDYYGISVHTYYEKKTLFLEYLWLDLVLSPRIQIEYRISTVHNA
jgi:hypothetical protein